MTIEYMIFRREKPDTPLSWQPGHELSRSMRAQDAVLVLAALVASQAEPGRVYELVRRKPVRGKQGRWKMIRETVCVAYVDRGEYASIYWHWDPLLIPPERLLPLLTMPGRLLEEEG